MTKHTECLRDIRDVSGEVSYAEIMHLRNIRDTQLLDLTKGFCAQRRRFLRI